MSKRTSWIPKGTPSAVAVAACLVAAAVAAAPASAAASSSSKPTCGALPLTSKSAVTAQAGSGTTAQGQHYNFNLDGSNVPVTVPPAGFRPATATQAELRAYGFPTRPSDAAGAATWDRNYGSWVSKPQAPLTACRTSVRAAIHPATSSNWAGGMNVNGSATTNSFTASEMRWVQPSFDTFCGSTGQGYSIWPGLGGWNSGRLIQAGTDITSSNVNAPYFWWEMLNGPTDTFETSINLAIRPGDSVGTAATYTASGASFFFTNFSTQQSASVGPIGSILGHPASYYYDGTTSDFISESPHLSSGNAPNGYAYLAHPTNGGVAVSYAITNGQAIATYPAWVITQTSKYSGTLQTSSFDGVHAWSDSWRNCY